jgi:pimeloyl-ACP methyl ester carboxylesterase
MIPKLLGPTTRQNKPQDIAQVRAMIEANRPDGIAQASIGMAERLDATPLLPQISCPTLVIVGSEDELTPPSEAEKISQAIPAAHLAVIPGAGHLSSLEQPEVFNRHVASFLRSR